MPQFLTSFNRSRALSMLMFGLGLVIIGRLFYLQVIQFSYYEAEANKEHTGKFSILASRGEIYAQNANGDIAPLVLNEPAYLVYADPRYVKDPQKIEDTMRRVAGGNMVSGFETSIRDTARQYVVLAKQINSQQAELIKSADLDGVGMQQYDKRVYPEGTLAAQVLGFVNGDGEGQYGIEQGFDKDLAGTPGLLKAVTDVHGIPLSVGQGGNVEIPAQNGKDLVLGIDRSIQSYAQQALKAGLDRVHATKGSVAIMNPNNGKMLAMASFPTFDPNNYQNVTDFSAFQNPTISQPYEPGSVMKPLTMAAGLDTGVVQPDTTFHNTGSVKVADATLKNASNDLLGGNPTMTQVLRYSFNTGAIFVLQQLGGGTITTGGKEKLYDYFTNHFFLAKPTGTGLAGEAGGQIFSPDDDQGGDVRYANMSFGQGLNVTMMQMLAAFSSAINGGTYYTPHIVAGYRTEDGKVSQIPPTVRKAGVVTPQTSTKLRDMLYQARITGPFVKQDKAGYFIGGKTGTAQVYDPKTGKYSETDTIGSFIGFGGQTGPEYVIMVRVDDAHIGDFAGSVAAEPIFSDISNWLIGYLNIQPRG